MAFFTETFKGEKRGYFAYYYVDRDLLREATKEIVELSKLENIKTECSKSVTKNHSRKEMKRRLVKKRKRAQ